VALLNKTYICNSTVNHNILSVKKKEERERGVATERKKTCTAGISPTLKSFQGPNLSKKRSQKASFYVIIPKQA
jgi:hypothetical protein